MAQKAHQPTNESRQLVRTLSGFGIPQEQICLLVGGGISKPTLHKHYRDDIDIGLAEANSKVVGALFQNAINGNVSAQIFWAKARMGWSEKPKTEGNDHGPVVFNTHLEPIPEWAEQRMREIEQNGGEWSKTEHSNQ